MLSQWQKTANLKHGCRCWDICYTLFFARIAWTPILVRVQLSLWFHSGIFCDRPQSRLDGWIDGRWKKRGARKKKDSPLWRHIHKREKRGGESYFFLPILRMISPKKKYRGHQKFIHTKKRREACFSGRCQIQSEQAGAREKRICLSGEGGDWQKKNVFSEFLFFALKFFFFCSLC